MHASIGVSAFEPARPLAAIDDAAVKAFFVAKLEDRLTDQISSTGLLMAAAR